MPIINRTESTQIDPSVYNLFPNQFVSQEKKRKPDWIKTNMDYFANAALQEFRHGRDTFLKNYELVKGNLTPEDFYLDSDTDAASKSMIQNMVDLEKLPKYVNNYSILNPPLSEMIGELSSRPDIVRVKAYDDDSKNEELQFKTDILQQYIIQNAKQKIVAKAAMQGGEPPNDDQIQQLTMEQVSDYLTDYTSLAERWGNHVLENAKMEYNMKEISEDGFRDLLICAREFHHLYEDNSKGGLAVECINPKNAWAIKTTDTKYIHKKAIAAGIVRVMEISEILNRFPFLTKKEIDHLRADQTTMGLFNPRKSNLDIPSARGAESIKYDTYNQGIVEERMRLESAIMENNDDISDWLGIQNSVSTFGHRYLVVEAYWWSKKKIIKVTFLDQDGNEQVALVDESYQKGGPNEISIEESYINQLYKGLRVGPDIYYAEEFNCLPYIPLIGVVFENKNVGRAKSFVDLIKPYQILFNVCMNQLFDLLKKEKGNVFMMSLRHVPTPKDGDAQDAITMWEEEAKEAGIIFVDDSPENTKGASTFNQFKNIDLTRTNEIQSRYQLAIELRNLAWELVGASKERLGSVAASQTATGTNTALAQSYSQTEPYFIQHEYLMNDFFQAVLDFTQYIEVQKPESNLAYINSEGEQSFIKVNSQDINLRDLKVYVTSRKKDQEQFKAIQQLAQPMLQNGAPAADVAEMFITDSMRKMKKVLKNLKDKQEQMMEQQQQQQQAEMQQQQQQFEMQHSQNQQASADQRAYEHNENELDRLSREKVALIGAMAMLKEDPQSLDNGAEAADLELRRKDIEMKQDQITHQMMLAQQKQQMDYQHSQDKLGVERQRTAADIHKTNTALKIAKLKPKPATPKKK